MVIDAHKVPRETILIGGAVVLVILGMVIFTFVSSAAASSQAKADIQKTHVAEITRQHTQQLGYEVMLPEVYEFTSAPGNKAVTPLFSYSMMKGPQSFGKVAVVAEQSSGQVTVDQADSGVMSDGFKCMWKNPCQPMSSDASGETIYSSSEPNSFYYYYGLTKGKSLIRVTSRKALPGNDVVDLVNSMKLATTAERESLKVDTAK